MVFAFPLGLAALHSVQLRPYPDPAEFRRGAEVFVKGKGIERCWMEDRQVIGHWFDGTRHIASEEAIWLSPALLSRWTGYLAAKEKWTNDQILSRWMTTEHIMRGKIALVVRLSAFPKRKLLEEDGERPNQDSIESLRFLITWDGANLPQRESQDDLFKLNPFLKRKPIQDWKVDGTTPDAHLFAALQGRERRDVDPFPWYQKCPMVEALAAEFPLPEPKGLEGLFGDFHSRWFWVEIPIETLPAKQFELRIFSPGKERIGTFKLPLISSR